jgi:hypothetical protein
MIAQSSFPLVTANAHAELTQSLTSACWRFDDSDRQNAGRTAIRPAGRRAGQRRHDGPPRRWEARGCVRAAAGTRTLVWGWRATERSNGRFETTKGWNTMNKHDIALRLELLYTELDQVHADNVYLQKRIDANNRCMATLERMIEQEKAITA